MNSKLKAVIGGLILAGSAVFFLSGMYQYSQAETLDMGGRFKALAVNGSLSNSEKTGTYNIDPRHSYIGFRVRHMGLVDVPGSFTDFAGSINFDADDVTKSSVEFTAQAKSIDTRVEPRNNHLRSKDFFEVETYPELTFKSTGVEKSGTKYIVKGNLTMKDVTKEVAIPFELFGPIENARGGIMLGVQGAITINRRDYNINYGGNLPSGVATVSDEVRVDLQLETNMKK